MKVKNYLYLIAMMFVFLNSNCQTTNKENKKQKSKIEFEIFTEIPSEIDGCSCFFSKNEKDYNENKYIFANDNASFHFIKVNGEMKKLKLIDYSKSENEKSFYQYKSEEFSLRIDISEKLPDGEETSKIKGFMTLTDKNGDTITQEFFGICGC